MEHSWKKIPFGTFRMASKCYVCKGSGLDICPVCNGNKRFNGKTCTKCGGRGVVRCSACHGTGITD